MRTGSPFIDAIHQHQEDIAAGEARERAVARECEHFNREVFQDGATWKYIVSTDNGICAEDDGYTSENDADAAAERTIITAATRRVDARN